MSKTVANVKNKQHKHKYGKLPGKLVITNPWEALYVDLIGPYTLKGKNGTVIEVMCIQLPVGLK